MIARTAARVGEYALYFVGVKPIEYATIIYVWDQYLRYWLGGPDG